MKTLFLIAGILGSMLALDYTGSWSYSVTGPDGMDYKGDIVLMTESGAYKGEIQTAGIAIPLKDLEIAGDEISFYIMMQGYKVSFNGTFEGLTLNAVGSVDGMEFPFKATKKE